MNKKIVSAWPKEKNSDKNPYNKLLYDAMGDNFVVEEFSRKKFFSKQYDILHVHWPDHMLRLDNSLKIRLRLWKFFRIIKHLQTCGGKLVWTVHNLKPHDISHPELVGSALKKIAERTDGFIFLSEVSKSAFFSLHPYAINKPSAVIPHLHYKGCYTNSSRKKVDREKQVQLLCFGLLREHKGYKKLFDIAQDIKYKKEVGWLIAGNPGKQGICKELEALWAKNQIIYKAIRHINDNEIEGLFKQCDAVILPYEDILNSGTAILALSLGKRVVAPAIGSLVELQKIVGSDWVYLYEKPIDKIKLEMAVEWVSSSYPVNEKPDLDMMSPKEVARQTMNFYSLLLE